MFRYLVLIGFLLAGCSGTPVPQSDRTEPYRTVPRPQTANFGSALPAGHTEYDNESLADLFVRLTHDFEDGTSRPTLQRFEGPVHVGMTGPGSQNYREFLGDLIEEIAREAKVPITTGPPPHNLTVRMVPGKDYLSSVSVQCSLAFGTPTWQQYVDDFAAYSGPAADHITSQTNMTVFIPETIEPYKVRECLIEEITQALGTANDLYGVASSIFNDDNAHTWPTKLDYLMLRVLYDPSMQSGLSRSTTKRRARMLLRELNPDGRSAPPLPEIRQKDFSDTRRTLHRANRPSIGEEEYLRVINRITAKARSEFRGTLYLCTLAYNQAFAALVNGHDTAADLFERTIRMCSELLGDRDIRIADLRLGLARAHYEAKDYAKALAGANAVIPIFTAYGREDRLAIASFYRVAAARKLKDPDAKGRYLDHAREWIAYAYGDDNDLTERLRAGKPTKDVPKSVL